MTKPSPSNSKREIDELAHAVERLHGAKAVFKGSEAVHEQFNGQTVWQGLVSQFELTGHPTATVCYAWSIPGEKVRYVAVLQTEHVNSPAKAVRASIIADTRREQK